MADTVEFFSTLLPEKLAKKPEIAADVKATFQFNVADAGTWSIDLTTPPGSVVTGEIAGAGCVVTVDKANFEKLLDNPALGMQLFMTGKLKASNVGLAMKLQKILS